MCIEFVEPIHRNTVPAVRLHGAATLNIGDSLHYYHCHTDKKQEKK